MSSILSGCHSVRNMIKIIDSGCPKCANLIEIFIRDTLQIGDSVCEKCGYRILGDTEYKEEI